MKDIFLLKPDITFLNFGSFGACPKQIFDDYQHWQLALEREPVQFMVHTGQAQLQRSRHALGKFINCNEDDVVFTTNPSYAINIVAKNLKLKPGDELLTTDLEYGALDRTWNYYSKAYGYTLKRQPIRLPLASKEDFIAQFWSGLSENTKVVYLSHITSSTALIFPVHEICARAKELGLITVVDGAHAPGQVHVDLQTLQADIYTGACHKWMMAPKGCSFLYAKKEIQSVLDPLVVSWGFESVAPSHSRFLDYHQMQGTRDFSAFLTVPKVIEFMEGHNWKNVAATCRKLSQENIPRFAELLNTHPLAPVSDEFFGQMCSLEIKTQNPERLKNELYNTHQIEIPVMVHGSKYYIRYSINAFNTQADLDKLYHALAECRKLKQLE